MGVYDYIREDYGTLNRETVPRKYFSGGFTGDVNINRTKNSSPIKGTGLFGKGFVVLVVLTTGGILATTPSVSAQEPLANPPVVSAQNSQNASDLINAAKEGNVRKVKELLKRGFDVNAKTNDGATALFLSSGIGYYDIVEYSPKGLGTGK